MDETHLAAAVRYVLLNPVRARPVARARDWPWSSLHAHLSGADDGVTTAGPMAERFPDLAGLLDPAGDDGDLQDRLRRAESIGRPLGDTAFLDAIAARLGRPVTAGRGGGAEGGGGGRELSAVSP
jgi:putative transposase